MKARTIIAACALGAFTSCTNTNKGDANVSDVDSIGVNSNDIVNDSITVENISYSDSLVQGQYKMGAEYKVDFPSSGNANLVRNIDEWINESLGGKYEGSLKNPDEMLKYYAKLNITPEQPTLEWNTENDVDIEKLCENNKFVSFQLSLYNFSGGAHGMTYSGGATFRKSDGRKLGWDMFRSDFEYSELFKDALMKQYFKVKTNEELENALMLQVPGYLPKPVTDPYFSKDGVTFVYQQYEIACYAAGSPTFTIPYSKVKPYLTVTALDLLK